MPELIGLDFETYSAVSLPKHGLMRYVQDDTFRVLIASVAVPGFNPETFDFINDRNAAIKLNNKLIDRTIVAHNALFEKVVLKAIGIDLPADRFLDSAVVARAAGAGGSLSAAAPQLLSVDKLDENKDLVRMFCMPSKQQVEDGELQFDKDLPSLMSTFWADFKQYCETDAYLSYRIAREYGDRLTSQEYEYMAITMDMNEAGWPVDMNLVQIMQHMYKANQAHALAGFQKDHGATDLNLNSLKQLKEWCVVRGIKATSFNEKHVAKLLTRIMVKLKSKGQLNPGQVQNYTEVRDLLVTKQILGGSSLKKLQVIIDTQQGGRLYDQYLHCGAGQTLRTTGRSAQMQNLKRLNVIADMDELQAPTMRWDNGKLAENLRQVFTASHPHGKLIVGDFSSVESRGLAWLAGEDWKLASYRQAADLYKVTAAKIYGIATEQVTKQQRQVGKVGELSCGYGAGPDAVVSFAEGMGVTLEQGEATKLVWDWRDANPKIVEFWKVLDDLLHLAVGGDTNTISLSDGCKLALRPVQMPRSLATMIPHGVSVEMQVSLRSGHPFMKRYFHGCHTRGRNICYFKPSDRKTGDLWKNTFIDPKTKQRRNYELYGGKLAGILTQSLCREIFFGVLREVADWTKRDPAVQLIGQFHDEIVLDWTPGVGRSVGTASVWFKELMSDAGPLTSFPLAADIKDDYRYTK